MLVAGSIEEQKKKQKKDKTEKPKQQDKKPIKAAAKQNGETKKEKKPAAKKADNNKYKYPFRLQYANQYLDPVSYTHLDVYKRQGNDPGTCYRIHKHGCGSKSLFQGCD